MTPGPDAFFSNLETPAEPHTEISESCPVSGWACSAGGIEAIDILVDGEQVRRIVPDVGREDVAAVHPEVEGSARSGFSALLDFRSREPGGHEVEVRVRNKAGERHEYRRSVRKIESILSHIDVPAEPQVVASETCLIRGWTCSPRGIDRVEILVDGELVQRFVPDGDRPDVAAVHPDVPGSARSGFDVTVELPLLAPGVHALQIVIRDGAGNQRRHDRSLQVYSNPYHRVLLEQQLTAHEREALRSALEATGRAPRFELWVDGRSGDDLGSTLRSIASQTYEHWTIRILASQSGDPRPSVPPAVFEAIRSRMSFATAFDAGADTADYLSFLLPGEKLLPDALLHVASQLAGAPASIVYSDHDLEEPTGIHTDPDYAPDWSPEHLYSRNYVGGVFFVALNEVRRHSLDPDRAAWRYDLLLRISESAERITHVPRVLWSSPHGFDPESAALADAERSAVESALKRRGVDADVVPAPGAPIRRVRRRLPFTPKVSIVIPTTGRPDVVRTLVESLLERTSYPSYELLFLDNGRGRWPDGIEYLRAKGLRVIERDEPFNWARLNNFGAGACDGELLLFLNDDIEVVEAEWLHELVVQALVPDVGSVGALLLYPEGRIQHAGIFLVDHGGGARHYLQLLDPRQATDQHLSDVTREVTASTGACLMVRRDVFEEAGGFDEEFRVAFNDVDLCLRLAADGYRNLWTPYCRLVHHESVSRKGTNIADDERRVWTKWGARLAVGDAYHNPNLAKDRGDCTVDTSVLNRRAAVSLPGDQHGVNLIGYVRAEMGMGEAARGLASAMESAAIPFVLIDYEYGNPARKGDHSWSHRIVERPRHDVNILCVNANLTPDARGRLGEGLFEGRHTIGYWLWELPEFPDRWVSSFEHVDEVWAPSEFVREAIARKSTVPVTRVPIALQKGPGPYFERPFFGLPAAPFLFLTMFDTHSVMERKNPEGAIAAFRRAFSPVDRGVGLVLKVNNVDEGAGETLRALVGTHENIHVIDRTLTRHEVDSLLVCCDCLVSLHRSEGFGLPMAEAMAFGKPVIATCWSGNADFMDDTCVACVDFQLRPLGRDHGPYDAHQHWAEPDLECAARWMRTLSGDPAAAYRMGAAGQRRVRQKLSPAAVGELIRRKLAQIRRVSRRLS